MPRLRRKLVVVALALVAVCLIAGVLIRNALLADEVLAEIDLPSVDTIKIVYRTPQKVPAAIWGAGGLRYHVYSSGSEVSGWLTSELKYDYSTDVNLTYEVTGDRNVELHARDHVGWIISGTGVASMRSLT
jgi:hypothetical protein